MKKGDIVIIFIVSFLSFLPYAYLKEKDKTSYEVYIMVGGEPYQTLPLTGQFHKKDIPIHTSNGYNIVTIENEGVSISASNCYDHTCEQFGIKKQNGEVIVCLPHQLYIEVKER